MTTQQFIATFHPLCLTTLSSARSLLVGIPTVFCWSTAQQNVSDRTVVVSCYYGCLPLACLLPTAGCVLLLHWCLHLDPFMTLSPPLLVWHCPRVQGPHALPHLLPCAAHRTTGRRHHNRPTPSYRCFHRPHLFNYYNWLRSCVRPANGYWGCFLLGSQRPGPASGWDDNRPPHSYRRVNQPHL